jgi:predicted dehydrogenase
MAAAEGGVMVFAMAGLVLTLVTAPADVTGKWDGTLTGIRDDGSKNEDTALMILEQKDGTISGTVGGKESDQHPITSGKIEGNKITLDAKTESGREFHIELTLENDEMKGTIVTGERRGELRLRRRKE